MDGPTLLLSVGSLGFMRPASGTWGSAPPAVLVFVLLLCGAGSGWISAGCVLLAAGGTAACVVWGSYAEKRFGRKDAAEVVADETAGCAVAFVALPADVAARSSLAGVTHADGAVGAVLTAGIVVAVGFVAFRVFDIAKLQPARGLEALPGGWGVALDDLMAGVYALAVVQVVTRYLM
jgi:phosphatidylglycerophosphatase A